MRSLSLLVLVACSQPAAKPPSNAERAQPGSAGMPAEVTALVERWTQCWHFSGEEPYDAARRQEIVEAQAKYCPGNEDTRRRLQQRYAARPDVLDALKKLDEMK